MSTGDPTRSVVVERTFAHAPEKIWRALTVGPLLASWLMANDFQPVVGHRFQFRTTALPHWNGILDCEVLEVDPPHRLVYSWNASGDEAATGVRTVVTWTLLPEATGTRLRMEQSGFAPDQDNNYRGAQYGWQKYLGSLEVTLGDMP